MTETGGEPSYTIDDLSRYLERIRVELDRVETGWILFETSTRCFGVRQDDLVQAVNSAGIGRQFDYLQMVLLHDCVATLCRITDEPVPDRVTLGRAMHHARKHFHESAPEELKEAGRKLNSLVRSLEMQSLRTFRNHYIGHNLQDGQVSATHKQIPELAATLRDVTLTLLHLCNYRVMGSEQARSLKRDASKRLWDFVETGATHFVDDQVINVIERS